MKRLLIAAAAMSLLLGCETAPPRPELKIPDGMILVREVKIDPQLLVSCPSDLPLLGSNMPMATLERWAEARNRLNECYKRNEGLIKLLREVFPAAGAASAPAPAASNPS
jgi:hypothetical protein